MFYDKDSRGRVRYNFDFHDENEDQLPDHVQDAARDTL